MKTKNNLQDKTIKGFKKIKQYAEVFQVILHSVQEPIPTSTFLYTKSMGSNSLLCTTLQTTAPRMPVATSKTHKDSTLGQILG